MEALAADGQLVAYRHEQFWQCMDTLRDLRYLESLWDAGRGAVEDVVSAWHAESPGRRSRSRARADGRAVGRAARRAALHHRRHRLLRLLAARDAAVGERSARPRGVGGRADERRGAFAAEGAAPGGPSRGCASRRGRPDVCVPERPRSPTSSTRRPIRPCVAPTDRRRSVRHASSRARAGPWISPGTPARGRFLLTSSGAVYGRQPAEVTHVPEDYARRAPIRRTRRRPDAEAKRAAETLCAIYANRRGCSRRSRSVLRVRRAIPAARRASRRGQFHRATRCRAAPSASPATARPSGRTCMPRIWRCGSGRFCCAGSRCARTTSAPTSPISIARSRQRGRAALLPPARRADRQDGRCPAARLDRYVPDTARVRGELGLAHRRYRSKKRWRGRSDGTAARVGSTPCQPLSARCRSGPGASAAASRATSLPKSASITTAISRLRNSWLTPPSRPARDAVKFQKRKLRETYREEIIDQPRHGEQGLQYIVPLLIEFELSDDAVPGAVRLLPGARHYRAVHAVGSRQRRFPGDLRPGRLQDRLARPDELSADRVRRRNRQADAALDRHVDRGGSPAHAGVPRGVPGRLRAVPLRQHLSGRGRGNQPALHGAAARMVGPAGRLLGTRHRARRFRSRRWPWARGCSSAISRSTATCAVPITRRVSSRTQFAEQVSAVREVEAVAGRAASVDHARRDAQPARPGQEPGGGGATFRRGRPIDRANADEQESRASGSRRSLSTSSSAAVWRAPSRATRCSGTSDVEDPVGPAVRDGQSTSARRGGSWRVSSTWPRSKRRSSRSACGSSSSTSATAISTPARRPYHGGAKPVRLRRPRAGVLPRHADRSLRRRRRRSANSRSSAFRRPSIWRAIWRRSSPGIASVFPRGPKIVMHVGGMSPTPDAYDVDAACDRLLSALAALDTAGVDLLLENLPPYPWYFGGRWFGHVLCAADNTVAAVRGLGPGTLLRHLARRARMREVRRQPRSNSPTHVRALRPAPPHLRRRRHLRRGTAGRRRLGQFRRAAAVAARPRARRVIPEIWMGHHENGQAFRVALERADRNPLGQPPCSAGRASAGRRPDLRALTVLERRDDFHRPAGHRHQPDGHRASWSMRDRRVVGVVTDGDIRHAFVRGLNAA